MGCIKFVNAVVETS